MGFRFRRSIKILPGVRVNVSKSGFSTSVGRRGATMNFSSRGIRQTFGIPGTGISHSTFTPHAASSQRATLEPLSRSVDPARFGMPPKNPKRSLFGWIAVVSALASLVFPIPMGFVLVGFWIAYAATPTQQTLAARELDRRKMLWKSTVDQLGEHSTEADLQSALADIRELGLERADVGEALDILTGSAELLAFERESNGKLASIDGHDKVVGDEPCYYVATVFFDKRGPNDETGTLYLTSKRSVFLGDSLNAIPWNKVIDVRTDHKTLLIQRNDRQNPITFVCESYGAALKARWVAKNLIANAEAS